MPGLHEPVRYVDLALGALRRFPDRVAFRQDGRDLTYRRTLDLLARWVGIFAERGLRPGEGVGVLSPNRPEVWLGQTAAPMAGGRFTALHPMGSLDDHRYICDEAELRFLVVDPTYAERAAQLAQHCPSLTNVFTLGPAGVGEDINALAEDAYPARLDGGGHSADDIAWLLYTGGTTGVPKAAMLTETAVAQAWMSVAIGWDLPSDIRYLACAPISHAAGMLVTPTLLAGGTVVLHKAFDPGHWLETVAAERITVGLLVPTMIYGVLDRPELAAADLSSLQAVMYGASPMSPTRLAEGIERLGPVFCQLYGQTECAGIATSLWRAQHRADDLRRLTSCGTPMPGARIAILDDAGTPVADGATGEICVQGPMVMQGYWKQPELTAATLREGWLRTGDMAVRDEEGLFYIVDRRKDMIISGGFNVFPREIEDVLSAHSAVSAVAVIGVPDDKWGEAVKALVVVRPGARVEVVELIALVREHKGPVYAPKSIELLESPAPDRGRQTRQEDPPRPLLDRPRPNGALRGSPGRRGKASMSKTWQPVMAIICAAACGASLGSPARAAQGGDIQTFCAARHNDDAPWAAFYGPSYHVGMVPAQVTAAGANTWRCMDGRVWVCNVGADGYACQKMNPSLRPSAPVRQFCKTNPDADFVPMVVIGNSSSLWRCRGGAAEPIQSRVLDQRDFSKDAWRPLGQ